MSVRTKFSVLTNPDELFLIFRAAIFLLKLPGMIRRYGIHELVLRITPRRTRSPGDTLSLDRIIYLCQRVLWIFRGRNYSYSCFRRSLLLYHFLRSYGVQVVINFGARLVDGKLTGHSWLTLNGALYLEPQDKVDQFTYFFSMPPEDGTMELTKEYLSSLGEANFD